MIRLGRQVACVHAVALTAVIFPGLAPAPAGASEVQVTVKTVEEEAVRGVLTSLTMRDGAALRTMDGDQRRIALENIVRITTETPATPRGRRDSMLSLTNGDALYGTIVKGPNEAVAVETVDLGRLVIPLDSIARLDAARAARPSYRRSVEWLDRTGAADEDRILVTNGDIVRGFITSIEADGITIETTFGETGVPFRLIVAARLVSPKPPPPKPPYAVATLRSSGRLTLSDFAWSGDVVQATMAGGQRLRMEAERVVRLDVVGGRWEWLSGHQPISFEHTPMLSLPWEYALDRNVLGGPIRVGGKTYEHGIGVHSRSSLTYDLKGSYRRFVTSFGIDDDSGPHADVAVYVLVDGRRRFERSHVRRGTAYGPIHLDITKANHLELFVDFGDNGDLQDRFDWVEAALIR